MNSTANVVMWVLNGMENNKKKKRPEADPSFHAAFTTPYRFTFTVFTPRGTSVAGEWEANWVA